MGNPLYFIFWLIVLIFISFWVALLASVFYIFTYLFAQCIDPCAVSSYYRFSIYKF